VAQVVVLAGELVFGCGVDHDLQFPQGMGGYGPA
jgi:hypothetical protein